MIRADPLLEQSKEKIVSEMRIKPMVAGILAPTRSENLPPKSENIAVRKQGR